MRAVDSSEDVSKFIPDYTASNQKTFSSVTPMRASNLEMISVPLFLTNLATLKRLPPAKSK